MFAWRAMEERIPWWQPGEKKSARRAVEKTPRWKSQKADFPTPLGNPANPAGFPLSHSPGGYGRLTKIEHSLFYEKGDISNVVTMGTFLMSVDTLFIFLLTHAHSQRRLYLNHPS